MKKFLIFLLLVCGLAAQTIPAGVGLYSNGSTGGGGGGGSTAFSALTSGTNTSAAMVVGTGASLATSGSGTIDATTLLTKTWASPAAIGSTTPAAGSFTTLALSNQLSSTLATGTAPFVVASTTQVANLNVATAGTATNSTNSTNVGVTDDTATNATMYPLWVTNTTGNLPAKLSSTKLTFNPSSGLLTLGGNLTLGASTSAILGAAGNMTITAGTGNSRTLALQSTTSGGTATTFLTGNADQTLTIPGAFIRTPATITVTAGAGTIDVTKGYSQASVVAATALTASANGTAGEFVLIDITCDSTLRVVTLKNVDASTIATVSATVSLTTTVMLRSTGSAWVLVGGSPSLVDAAADTTPAATKLISTVNPTTGVVSKSTIAQINIVANGGTGAATLTGLVVGNGTSAFTTVTAPAGTVVGTSDTQTLTNKRETPRITTITSSATPTVNTDNCDCVTITALAAAITSMTTNLSGTPNNFDQLEYRILDNNTARAITWGASFVAGNAALPTTTTQNKALHVWFEWDSVRAAWVCVGTGSDA